MSLRFVLKLILFTSIVVAFALLFKKLTVPEGIETPLPNSLKITKKISLQNIQDSENSENSGLINFPN